MANAIGVEEIEDEDAFSRMNEKFKANSPKARKAREKKVRGAVDARKLRERSVTVQLNCRVAPEIKDRIAFAAKRKGLTIQEWVTAAALELTDELEGDGEE